jgi:hypothetical protein
MVLSKRRYTNKTTRRDKPQGGYLNNYHRETLKFASYSIDLLTDRSIDLID